MAAQQLASSLFNAASYVVDEHSHQQNRRNAQVVPFYGRDVVLAADDPLYVETLRSLTELSQQLSRIASAKQGETLWMNLNNSLSDFVARSFMDPQHPPKRWVAEFLVEAVIPYLQEIQKRIHTDVARFHQVLAPPVTVSCECRKPITRWCRSHLCSSLIPFLCARGHLLCICV